MTDSLHTLYRATDYRVRLAHGGHASIRIGAPLPTPLCNWLHDDAEPWAFITAWHPRSQQQSRAANHRAQRDLLAALRAMTPPPRIHAGVGVGCNGWRESSLFVLGLDFNLFDLLAQRSAQNAIVRGRGPGVAKLRVVPMPSA